MSCSSRMLRSRLFSCSFNPGTLVIVVDMVEEVEVVEEVDVEVDVIVSSALQW